MNAVLCSLMGYLVGTINPAYIFGKIKGFDIRNRGSRNAGASNAVILLGKAVGFICAVFDILKAFFTYKLAKIIFPSLPYAAALAGSACIIGHIFPIWMNFHGGKGLACLGGTILAYNWIFAFILLAVEIILVLSVDYICVIALTASIVLPIAYGIGTADLIGTAALAVVAVVIWIKHMENLTRIKEGSEAHFSFLWRKDEEIERLKDKYSSEQATE